MHSKVTRVEHTIQNTKNWNKKSFSINLIYILNLNITEYFQVSKNFVVQPGRILRDL